MSWRRGTTTGSARPTAAGETRPEDMNPEHPGAGPAGEQAPRTSSAQPENAGWSIFSYLIAGMVAYGLVGWLVATLTHIRLLLPLGALAGLVVGIAGIVYKYGRS
jgi:ATP synthase protein I